MLSSSPKTAYAKGLSADTFLAKDAKRSQNLPRKLARADHGHAVDLPEEENSPLQIGFLTKRFQKTLAYIPHVVRYRFLKMLNTAATKIRMAMEVRSMESTRKAWIAPLCFRK